MASQSQTTSVNPPNSFAPQWQISYYLTHLSQTGLFPRSLGLIPVGRGLWVAAPALPNVKGRLVPAKQKVLAVETGKASFTVVPPNAYTTIPRLAILSNIGCKEDSKIVGMAVGGPSDGTAALQGIYKTADRQMKRITNSNTITYVLTSSNINNTNNILASNNLPRQMTACVRSNAVETNNNVVDNTNNQLSHRNMQQRFGTYSCCKNPVPRSATIYMTKPINFPRECNPTTASATTTSTVDSALPQTTTAHKSKPYQNHLH